MYWNGSKKPWQIFLLFLGIYFLIRRMGNLSKNFSVKELGLDKIPADQPREVILANYKDMATGLLQPIRDSLGKPLKISSGYRSPGKNKMVDGSRTSKHMGITGAAADIYSPGVHPLDLFNHIKNRFPYDSMIYYMPGSKGYKYGGVHIAYVRGSARQQNFNAINGEYFPAK